MSNSSFTPSPPIGQWRVLVPEASVLQSSAAYQVSPLIHDEPIQKSFLDRREKYVNEHTLAAQDDGEQSATKQLLKRNTCSSAIPSKHPAAESTSRHPDASDARPTTTPTDVPSISVSRPLPVSPEKGTSYVDVIENRPPSTRFTDHNSPLLNRTLVNPTLYTMRGMY